MTEIATESDTLGKNWTRIVVLTGWFLTLVVALGIIGASVAVLVAKGVLPADLKSMCDLSLGFLFANVVQLAKDHI